MSPESTRMLVEQAQAGDTRAFESLVEYYYTMVHGLALSRVGDWAAADDLTQDVFLVAWTNLSRLRAPGAFLVWIRRIARNASLNWIRARDYRRKLADRHVQQNGPEIPVEPDPSASASREECAEQVRAALGSLSPKLRDAMTLYYLEGQTASAAAESLDISVDTMKKRLRLGRAKLQRYYAGRQIDEIEQVLPHTPKRRIEQIVAGLFVGPVMPEWGAKTAARAAASTTGVLSTAASTGTVLLGAAASMAVLAGVGFHVNRDAATLDRPIESLDVTESAAAEVAVIDDTVVVPSIRVESAIAPVDPNARGLQTGDDITEINGLDVNAVGPIHGVPGAPVRVTFIPSDGNRTPRSTVVVWPFLPKRFGTS